MTPPDRRAGLIVRRLPQGYSPGAFRCGEPEIDGYLHDGDAARDEDLWLARTYIVEEGEHCVAYFSLLADAIRLDLKEAEAAQSRYQAAPALKIARVGVCRRYKGLQIGEFVLEVILGVVQTLARDVGIRYVTLDALPRQKLVDWYFKQGFVSNSGEAEYRKLMLSPNPGKVEQVVSMRLDIRKGPSTGSTEDHPTEGYTSATDIY